MKKEPTRIREGGTAVMNASTAADMLAAFRAIVAKGYAKLNGVAIDITTASMVTRVTDALNEANRIKWFAKVDGYFAEKKDPAIITVFWVDTFWKLTK